MPRYSRRGRSSSSSSTSSNSPSPKHRLRSPWKIITSARFPPGKRSPERHPGGGSRRSRSRSPKRQRSPSPRRRSPPRRETRRRTPPRSNRRSPSPKRRRSPPRSRPRAPSPRPQRRSPPRHRSPPREIIPGLDLPPPEDERPESKQEPPRDQRALHDHTRESSKDLPGDRRREDARGESRRDSREWTSSMVDSEHSRRAEGVHLHSQSEKQQSLPGRDYREPTRDLRYDNIVRQESREMPSSSRHVPPLDSHDQRGLDSRSADQHRLRPRSRSPYYERQAPSSTAGILNRSRSPVERRLEAERNYGWVHAQEESSVTHPADRVRVSVNLSSSHSGGDLDMRQERVSQSWNRGPESSDRDRDYRNLPPNQDLQSRRSKDDREDKHDHDERRDRDERRESAITIRPKESRSYLQDAHRVFPPSSASTVPTRGSLSGRFGIGTANEKSFIPKENITVGIQRNIKGGVEGLPIRRDYHESEVVLVRRKEEGTTPLCRREEFETPPEEVIERRVVKVVLPDVDPSKVSRHVEHKRENFEVRRENFENRPSLSDRWQEGDSRMVDDRVSYRREERLEVVQRDDYRRPQESSHVSSHQQDRDHRLVAERRPRDDVRHYSPVGTRTDRDERYVSDSGRRFISSSKPETFSQDEDLRSKERFESDPNDLRHNLSRRRQSDKEERSDIRMRIGQRRDTDYRSGASSQERTLDKKRDGDRLPDFSKRPDKYSFEEWKEKPEMIPKGSSYFETKPTQVKKPKDTDLLMEGHVSSHTTGSKIGHQWQIKRDNSHRLHGDRCNRSASPFQHDNRDTYLPSFDRRGRGRGFTFRGRGRGRGRGFVPFRGRGRGRGRGYPYVPVRSEYKPGKTSGEREWKHDKFKEVDEGCDDKPSSTTNK